MSFKNPEYLLLLFILPLLAYISFLGIKNFLYAKNILINTTNFKKIGLTTNLNEKYLSIFIWLLSIGLIVFSLAGPIGGEIYNEIEDTGKDIVIALDVSDSMRARDVTISGSYSDLAIREDLSDLSRFDASKKVIKGLIKNLKGDRVSLVAFSETAFPLSPLGNDYDSFISYLNSLDYSYLNEGGTNIDQALEISEKRFINKDKNKLIILISDGEEHNNKAIERAKHLSEKNIKIITIGIGSKEGSKILLGNDIYDEPQYKTYLGQEVITKLNDSLLKDISKITGGIYFQLGNENISPYITNFIDKDKSPSNSKEKIKTYNEYYQVFTLIALILIFLEILIKKAKKASQNI